MGADRTADLVARARLGDDGALSGLFETFRPHLVRMVGLRLDAALRPRLDPDDVVQQSPAMELHWSLAPDEVAVRYVGRKLRSINDEDLQAFPSQ